MSALRPIPSADSLLYSVSDFVIDSPLGRRAFQTSIPGYVNFIQDLLTVIHRLVQSCHLPEFTDHGLPHLSSLVDRCSRWTLKGGARLVATIEPEEAARLLLAILVHDLGMLSQAPEHVPDTLTDRFGRHTVDDAGLAGWVRQTHVVRLSNLVAAVVVEIFSGVPPQRLQIVLDDAVEIGMAHAEWPEQWSQRSDRREWRTRWHLNDRFRGLAAVLSVCDLLDEDARRCDTATLVRHRSGDLANNSHWLRHLLTGNRVLVDRAEIEVEFRSLPNTTARMNPVYTGLRNQFRLVKLYNPALKAIEAEIERVQFIPHDGNSDLYVEGTAPEWQDIEGFPTDSALAVHLLHTLMSEARRDRPTPLRNIGLCELQDLDLADYSKVYGPTGLGGPKTPAEIIADAIDLN